MRVLVAAVSELQRMVIREALDGAEHDVLHAEVGALAGGDEGDGADILLLAHPQPLDYLSTVRERRVPEGSGRPYLLVHVSHEEAGRALGAGADDVMTEPITPHLLLSRIEVARRRIHDHRALRERERELASARTMVRDVLALEHDINNPLSALIGMLSLASDSDSTEEHREAIDFALTQARRVAAVARRMGAMKHELADASDGGTAAPVSPDAA